MNKDDKMAMIKDKLKRKLSRKKDTKNEANSRD